MHHEPDYFSIDGEVLRRNYLNSYLLFCFHLDGIDFAIQFGMNDRRIHQRRPLAVPVVCYPNGGSNDPGNCFFGKTIDVSMDGLRLYCKHLCMVEPGAELNLLVFNIERQHDLQADAPSCIRIQVCWVDSPQQVFGVQYLE